MDRLRVTGPHRESGSLPGEYGYGWYWHAVDGDGMIWSWSMTTKGSELDATARRRLLARGRKRRLFQFYK